MLDTNLTREQWEKIEQDRFYLEDRALTQIFYNPDSFEGGQFVRCEASFFDEEELKVQLDFILENGIMDEPHREWCIDRNDDENSEYNYMLKEILEDRDEADAVGISEESMKKLLDKFHRLYDK